MSSEAFDLGSEEMTASELDAEDLSRSYVILRFFLLLLYSFMVLVVMNQAAWALAKHISLVYLLKFKTMSFQ